jgi:hypothetical protein
MWYLFVLHVNPYVWLSIVRCHKIEQDLRERVFDIRLHKSIYSFKQTLKGIHITVALLCVFVGAWFGRLIILWQNLFEYILLSCGVSILLICVLHFYIYSRTDWRKKIQTILEEGEKTEIILIEKRIQILEKDIEDIIQQENQEKNRNAFEAFRKELMDRIKILCAKS